MRIPLGAPRRLALHHTHDRSETLSVGVLQVHLIVVCLNGQL